MHPVLHLLATLGTYRESSPSDAEVKPLVQMLHVPSQTPNVSGEPGTVWDHSWGPYDGHVRRLNPDGTPDLVRPRGGYFVGYCNWSRRGGI